MVSSQPSAGIFKMGCFRRSPSKRHKIWPRSACSHHKIWRQYPSSVGSVNDIDDIFIEDSGNGAQPSRRLSALQSIETNGWNDIDDIVAEIRKHSKDEDQKRLLRIFLPIQQLDGGDLKMREFAWKSKWTISWIKTCSQRLSGRNIKILDIALGKGGGDDIKTKPLL